jgi:hypothetical protein
MIADVGAGINVGRLDVLVDNPDFVTVHDKLISNRQIPECHSGIVRLN